MRGPVFAGIQLVLVTLPIVGSLSYSGPNKTPPKHDRNQSDHESRPRRHPRIQMG